MPGARDLKHDRSQPVTHEVMDVTSDPTALLEHRPLGQLTPRGLQRSRQLRLTEDRAPDQPRKRDPQDPDRDRDIASGLDHAHHHRRGDRQQAERDRRRERPRPAPHHKREHRDLEHQRLVASGALGHDDRHHHRYRNHPQGHAPQTGPQHERRDRNHHQNQINDRRRVSQSTHNRDRKREDRNKEPHLICLGPRRT